MPATTVTVITVFHSPDAKLVAAEDKDPCALPPNPVAV
jgi:hypothetical protein